MSPGVNPTRAAYEAGFVDSHISSADRRATVGPGAVGHAKGTLSAMQNATEIRYYGVSVLTWHHADPRRHQGLLRLKSNMGSDGQLRRPESMRSFYTSATAPQGSLDLKAKKKRRKVPWKTRTEHVETVSEVDTAFTDTEVESPPGRLGIKVASAPPKRRRLQSCSRQTMAHLSPNRAMSSGFR